MSTPTTFPRATLWQRFRLRRRRQRYLWRAFRARRDLRSVQDHVSHIKPGDILAVVVLRNEETRLPHFLEHYDALGVDHYLIVDNGSDDGTRTLLRARQNVSIWETNTSYRTSRFGLDWANHLLARYGHGHWCLTIDADELLVLPKEFGANVRAATRALEASQRPVLGALMLDLCPEEELGAREYSAGQNPIEVLPFLSTGPYRKKRQSPLGNLWVQGGLREQVFFPKTPRKSPTLNKLPLVKWHRRWAYVNSTHSILPPRLNALYDGPGGETPAAVLLHTKFLPEIVSKSETERERREHFHAPDQFEDYYDQIAKRPVLKTDSCVRYEGPEQLEKLGLLGIGRERLTLSIPKRD